MSVNINELTERLSDRLAQIRTVREILAENRDSEISEELIKNMDRMYRRISECSEEILKMKNTENEYE